MVLTTTVQKEINQNILKFDPDIPSKYPNSCDKEKHNFGSQQYLVSMNVTWPGSKSTTRLR